MLLKAVRKQLKNFHFILYRNPCVYTSLKRSFLSSNLAKENVSASASSRLYTMKKITPRLDIDWGRSEDKLDALPSQLSELSPISETQEQSSANKRVNCPENFGCTIKNLHSSPQRVPGTGFEVPDAYRIWVLDILSIQSSNNIAWLQTKYKGWMPNWRET